MEKKNYLWICTLLLCFTGKLLYAQCSVDLGDNISITCGDTIQLHGDQTWTWSLDASTKQQLDIFFTSESIGYTVGSSGILKTTDGGLNWNVQNSTGSLRAVYFVDADTGIVVGNNGLILRTTDGGTNWIQQMSGTTEALVDVVFGDDKTGFIIGQNNIFLKTTDAGKNWTSKPTNIGLLGNTDFPSANIGYSVTSKKIYKTTDGGENWSLLVNSTLTGPESYTKPFFLNDTCGYVTGWNQSVPASVYKTMDGGNSWSKVIVDSQPGSSLEGIFFLNEKTGFVGGTGKIFKTTDGGISWFKQRVGLSIYAIHFPTERTGYAIGPIFGTGSLPLAKYTIPDSVSWTPSLGLTSSTSLNVLASPTKTTTYSVKTITNGCMATDTIQIIVNDFQISHSTVPIINCGGSTELQITHNYKGNGNLQYSWTPVKGLSSATIPNPIVTASQTATYTITVTTPNGCVAPDSIAITVLPMVVKAGKGKLIVCGSSTQLESVITAYAGNNTLTYSWWPNNNLSDTTITNPVSTPNESIMYHVIVTSPEGCRATDSVYIAVDSLTVFAGADKLHVCGDGVQFNEVTTNYKGTIPLLYSWSPSVGLSDITIANPVSTASAVTYTVTVKTANGCEAMDQIKVDLKKMSTPEICMVGVDSGGKNVIRWNTLGSDALDSVLIYKETAIAENYIQIGKVHGSENSYRDTTSQPEKKSSKYKISLLDSCGLESEKSLYHKTMHLAITQGVGTSWNLIWEPYEGFAVLKYNIYRGTDESNLQFIDVTSGTITQFTNYNPPPVDLYYQVEVVVNPAPCDPSNEAKALRSNVAASKYVGIFEQQKNTFLFSIYPNPANNLLTVNLENAISQNLNLTIYNAIGAIVKTMVIQQSQQQIDVSDLNNGLYMIELKSTDGYAVQKLTIDK